MPRGAIAVGCSGVVGVALAAFAALGAGCGLATSGLLDEPSAVTGVHGRDGGSAATPTPPSGLVDATAPMREAGGDDGEGADAARDSAIADSCSMTEDAAAVASIAHLAVAPKIDGDLSDWPCDGWIDLTRATAAYVKAGGDVIAGRVSVRWDQDNVYVAVHVTDPSVVGSDGIDPYKNDSIELYASGNPAPNGDYDAMSHQWITDWKGLTVDYGPAHYGQLANMMPPHFNAKTTRTPAGWDLEAALGWQALQGGAFAASGKLGLDLQLNDSDGFQQNGALLLVLAPAASACTCRQACCCGQPVDLPYCDSQRMGRVTLQ